eukprot:TRINITY_DN1420_c0_g1_i5.p1 TRINITY_DN1420_c0_g1~~TRINITY_DN1420_c0_g1_i5.p1  ORF type:complete len:261 (+),score=47.14 TRINITY_DN1420_c0_g1_i5:37-819(+)
MFGFEGSDESSAAMSTKCLTPQGSDLVVQHASFPTTLMIQNITCRATSEEVLGKINALGFDGTYDFFYLPQRFGSRKPSSSLTHHGYAFINFKTSNISQLFMHTLQNTCVTLRDSSKILSVCYAHVQGVEKLTMAVKRSKKNPAARPWFENGPPGLLVSDDESLAVKPPSLSSLPPLSDDYENIKHVDAHDAKVPTAHEVLRFHPAKAAMKDAGFDTFLWSTRQRVLPDGEPMSIPVNTAYFDEDPWWESFMHQLRLDSA